MLTQRSIAPTSAVCLNCSACLLRPACWFPSALRCGVVWRDVQAKPDVAGAADRVLRRLAMVDPELHEHLIHATTLQAPDRQKVLTGIKMIPHTATAQNKAAAHDLQYSTVFIRKWLGEAFVDIVREGAVLFIWDQCVMTSWSALEDFALVILLLLARTLLSADSYAKVQRVMFVETRRLFTRDICRAFQHFKAGRPLEEIEHLNHAGNLMDVVGLRQPEKESEGDVAVASTVDPFLTDADTLAREATFMLNEDEEVSLDFAANDLAALEREFADVVDAGATAVRGPNFTVDLLAS